MGHLSISVKAGFAVLGILLNLIVATSSSIAAPPRLHITRITPSGTDVPAGRQIVFQFDKPVVPIGRMARQVSACSNFLGPIVITPSLKCQWRWLNTGTLACQLDEKSAMSPATCYTIVVNPGIKTLDGATLEKAVRHSFTTERPQVQNAWFKTWRGPGMPVIRLTFNQPVFKNSVAPTHLYGSQRQNGKTNGHYH